MTYIIQTPDGQVQDVHSISAGLDYPGVGPEHAYLLKQGRTEYVAVRDKAGHSKHYKNSHKKKV